jgi:hypothetical protein
VDKHKPPTDHVMVVYYNVCGWGGGGLWAWAIGLPCDRWSAFEPIGVSYVRVENWFFVRGGGG